MDGRGTAPARHGADRLTYADNRFDLERYRELEGLSLAMLGELLSAPPAKLSEVYALEKGYPTPKVDVRAALFSGGRVLLVKEWIDGGWTLPGGWADEGDSPREAAERECREESGYEAKVVRLVAVRDRSRHAYLPRHVGGVYKLIFLAELTGGTARVSHETTDVRFFALDELPALSLARTLPDDIALAYRHELDRSLLPTFD